MTPLALKLMKALLNNADNPKVVAALKEWSQVHCFDVTDISELVQRTAKDLRYGVNVNGSLSEIEHGGLMFLPSPFTWIELGDKHKKVRIGFFLQEVEDEIGFNVIGTNETGDIKQLYNGFFSLDTNNDTFKLYYDKRVHAEAPKGPEFIGLSTWLAGAILAINAPYGLERKSYPAHKSVQRAVKRLGVGPFLPVHTIHLSRKTGNLGEGAGEGGSPKAFHFCRSHLRRLPNCAGMTRVRAHWRGDPSLGIHQTNYKAHL